MSTKEAEMSRAFEDKIRKLISRRSSGYKTFGGISGGLLGSGIGGTKGLMDAAESQRRGEMDELTGTEKIKEYLKSMTSAGKKGLYAGGVLGLGGGALLKRRDVGNTLNRIKPQINSVLEEYHPILKPQVEDMVHDSLKETLPRFNMVEHVVNRLRGK